jgi:opacity protein-like surface antigen
LNVLVGPQFSLRSGKFIFDFRLLGGLVKSLSTPEMTVLLEDQTGTTFKQSSSTASAFGWQVGTGTRYPLNDKLSLMLKVDYFSSAGVTVGNENRNNSAGRLVTNQPMSWVNITVGIAVSLNKK